MDDDEFPSELGVEPEALTSGTEDAGLQEVTAGPDDGGQRLDKFLADAFPALSRSYLKHLIEKARVTKDGVMETSVSAKVKVGALYRVAVPPPEPAVPEAENIPLTILYEDAHVLVVDKPAGLSVHPAPGNWTGTLVNAVLWHAGDSLKVVGAMGRPGIVHRLDKDTSGVMVVCKSTFALSSLGRQFQDRTIDRQYRAFGVGQPKAPWTKIGRIDARLGRDPRERKKIAVLPDTAQAGKNAVTNYEIVKRFGIGLQGNAGAGACEMICVLETGRTHQIRVHMAHIGVPLIGDQVYGDTKAARALNSALPEETRLLRQALHAQTLSFTHPATSQRMSFASDLPADLVALQEALATL
jgi:23S rRNA pseudouridine1911/1915/1917 synthase